MQYAGVISKFANRIRRKLSPEIYGNGLQTQVFVYVDDVVDALMRAGCLVNIQFNDQHFPSEQISLHHEIHGLAMNGYVNLR